MSRSALPYIALGLGVIAACGGSGASITSSSSGGSGGPPGDGDGGGPIDDGGSTKDAPATTGPSGLPCDVDAVLGANCRQCHGNPTSYGAPMPLMTWNDLQAPAKSNAQKKVYELVGARIHDDAKPMPQPPNARLSTKDTATLDQWIGKGAPGSSDACTPVPPADAGVPKLACTPDEHMTPASAWAMPQTTDDVYVCYGFDVQRAAKRHVIGMVPRVGNSKIVHHILLFQDPTGSGRGTTPTPCSAGGSTSWRLIYGWAPGGLPMDMPAAAGFPEDPGTTHYIVQVHYNNINHLAGETDTSGFDTCTTDQLRPNDADIIAFGTTNIKIPPHSKLDVTCSISVQQSFDNAHIFAAMPHMHKLGTVISTTDGPTDLGTKPNWDFQSQAFVPLNAVLHGGDTIKTRCAWNNTTDQPVSFGENTENEMCFSFTMYYPRVVGLPSWAAPAYLSQCAPTP